MTTQTSGITGYCFLPGIIWWFHTVTPCTEFRRDRFMCSYHNQRDTTYYGQDCHYGQYFNGLHIFYNIFQHRI